MVEVTNELLMDVLKSIQDRIVKLDGSTRDMKEELVAMRLHQHASQGEINSIFGRLGSIELRLERIENRLDIVSEPAE